MRLTAVVDDLTAVDEALRENYAQRDDGKFYLALENIEHASDVTGLKSALQKERQNNRELERIKARLGGDAGIESVAKFREQFKDVDPATLAAQLDETTGTLKRVQRSLAQAVADKEILSATANHRAMQDRLLPLLREKVKTVEQEDGSVVVRVLDGNAVAKAEDGTPITVDQLVESMRNDEAFAYAFYGTGQSGSGAQGSATRGGGAPANRSDLQRSKMSSKAKVQYLKQYGENEFMKLPW